MSANNVKASKKISFSVIRYGNVLGSRGSVLPELKKNKKVSFVTDKEMTRFNISLEQAVELVIWSIKNSIGGEIIVPKIPSYRILDFVKAVNPNSKIKIIGIRPGEKIHEEMVASNESHNTLELKDKYLIVNNFFKNKIFEYYKNNFNAKKVKKNFNYSSEKNRFLTIEQLRNIIKKNDF